LHPWQRAKSETGEEYYYNSATEESEWDKPKVLDGVLDLMREHHNAAAAAAPALLEKVESPKPVAPKGVDIEQLPQFRYELQTYEVKTAFEKSHLLGFKYRENPDGQAVVRKIVRMTSASSLVNGCEGMVLVRVKAGGGSGGERSVAGMGFDKTLKLLERRPLQLTFEHPWQKEKDDSGSVYYFNSLTEQSQWERPIELGPVVESMREWYGDGSGSGGADETNSPSPSPRAGGSGAAGSSAMPVRVELMPPIIFSQVAAISHFSLMSLSLLSFLSHFSHFSRSLSGGGAGRHDCWVPF